MESFRQETFGTRPLEVDIILLIDDESMKCFRSALHRGMMGNFGLFYCGLDG